MHLSPAAIDGAIRLLDSPGIRSGVGSMDLLIAATAISLDVRLITHNVKEFGRVPGLRIEDWA